MGDPRESPVEELFRYPEAPCCPVNRRLLVYAISTAGGPAATSIAGIVPGLVDDGSATRRGESPPFQDLGRARGSLFPMARRTERAFPKSRSVGRRLFRI